MANAMAWILIVAIVLLSAYLLCLVVLDLSPLLAQAPQPKNVDVGGVISTGILTRPVIATFTSESTGRRYFTTISDGGHYSISLLGNDTYAVTVYYSGLFGNATSANCSSHVLALNGSADAAKFTMNC